jgi:hypothetical protein
MCSLFDGWIYIYVNVYDFCTSVNFVYINLSLAYLVLSTHILV